MQRVEYVIVHQFPSEVVVEVVESDPDIDLEVSSYSFERVEGSKVTPREEIPSKFEDFCREKLAENGFVVI